MKIYKLGYEIIDVAASYVTPESICYETSKNRGECIDEIYNYFHETDEAKSEPYCASFTSVVVDKACKNLGIENIYPHTPSAGSIAKLATYAGLMVDKIPAPGCVFTTYSAQADSGRHAGIVVKVEYDRIYTIEGNSTFQIGGKTYDGVWSHYYPPTGTVLNEKYLVNNKFDFIHTEMMGGDNFVDVNYDYDISKPFTQSAISKAGLSGPLGKFLIIGLIGTAGYLYFKKPKFIKKYI
jgi:hypothetical protein